MRFSGFWTALRKQRSGYRRAAIFLSLEADAAVAGFLVWRQTAPDEVEILNLAVDTAFRRQGIAKALLAGLPACDVFLEVRESNLPALRLVPARPDSARWVCVPGTISIPWRGPLSCDCNRDSFGVEATHRG